VRSQRQKRKRLRMTQDERVQNKKRDEIQMSPRHKNELIQNQSIWHKREDDSRSRRYKMKKRDLNILARHANVSLVECLTHFHCFCDCSCN